MDRNLGAISATPGDVGALGLLYQWGRKDPFLNSSDISTAAIAASTTTWPKAVLNSVGGTVDYVTANPTTYILTPSNTVNSHDWLKSANAGLWSEDKTIYDPCPAEWRVPEGGDNGLWSKAGFKYTVYDDTNEGMFFFISEPASTWYPKTWSQRGSDGALCSFSGSYWSCSSYNDNAYAFNFMSISDNRSRDYAFAIRCVKE